MKNIKVKDYPNLVKSDAAVINTDKSGYESALIRAAKTKKDRELENRVSNLESKLDIIISLLRK